MHTVTRSLSHRLLLGMLVSAPLAGCGADTGVDPAGGEAITEAADPLVTTVSGTLVAPITSTATDRSQSETALALGLSGSTPIVVAAYNDMTNTASKIDISPSLAIHTGASLMGWSTSSDSGGSWSKKTQLAPPSGIAALWGDPAAVANKKNAAFVYMTNLAALQSKWPAGGVADSTQLENALGGACVARSTNGGLTFSFSASQPCLINANQDFYDGAFMASGPNGAVYAAFRDTNNSTIAVWQALNETANFAELPNPFPGVTIWDHPRIRVDAANTLYALAQDNNGDLWLNRRTFTGSWGSAVHFTVHAAIGPNITFASSTVRTGPQYSFDVGSASVNANDSVRVIYTYLDTNNGNVLHLDAVYCNAALTNCQRPAQNGQGGWAYPPPGWPTNTGDQFNPVVSFGTGSGGVASKWKMSFWSREEYVLGNDQIIPMAADLAVNGINQALNNIVQLATPQTPCPDLAGYWGDYDGMIALAADSAGKPRFLRAISDSSGATCVPQNLVSTLHLTSLRFN